MNKRRQILWSTACCFKTWSNTPRVIVLILMIACLIVICAYPFAENARIQGESLQFSEMFIALMNWRFTMLLFSSAALMLFGDLPIVDRFDIVALARGARRPWLFSQILYIVCASFILVLFIFMTTVVMTIPNVAWNNDWSRPVKLLALSNRIALPAAQMKMTMPVYIVRNFSPMQAFINSFMLFFLMSCFYGLCSLMLRIWLRIGAFIILMIINVFSWSVAVFDPSSTIFAITLLLSVHYHASLYMHELSALNPLLVSIEASYWILGGWIGVIVTLSIIKIKRYDFAIMEKGGL